MTADDRRGQQPQNILDLVRAGAVRSGDGPALGAPGRHAIGYRELLSSIESVGRTLARLGIQPADRIALVHPGGPDYAVALLAIATVAACAPLNPAYQEPELEFYLADLGAKALVTGAGIDAPARAVARRLGIPVIDMESAAGAGHIAFHGPPVGPSCPYLLGDAASAAIVLYTSGTTSRPKLAPLSHGNLCASAMGLARALELVPADRCLNVMPLFHIHGISAGLLAPLVSGGSALCPPGFHAFSFFSWVDELRPTWYTAAPTMHQAILGAAPVDAPAGGRGAMRFIRSASAALAPTVMRELEDVFGVPVIEGYGMTEAATLITANPLPPRVRKPGSVGVPIGTDVALLTDRGIVGDSGVEGEVVIKGPAVIGGYATATVDGDIFVDGWLRTGDIGRFDGDGYLFLIGRSREIICRGAEKISPIEIDEALLAHPDVAHAVAFALPDSLLGEDVAAAVVVKPGVSRSEHELRDFLSRRLAFFKVPRRIFLVDRIPVGASGKTQRRSLATMLGVQASPPTVAPHASPFEAPRTPVEESLAQMSVELLAVDRIGIHDDLFRLGVDSLLATQMVARIRQRFGVDFPLLALFESATIAELAPRVEALLTETS